MPQSTDRLYTLTATQALSLIRNDTITVEEYARDILDRIQERDAIIKAWAYFDEKHVLDQARALDQVPRGQRGPLHGVAVGIKDVMNTKDMPTEYGSALYRGNRPSNDASPISILRSAGALIIGKTTTTEFTVLNSGPETTNPRDIRRTPGGSSAGSAAAVADLQVPLSLGTQNGGSIIRPASFTGIYAMKPTLNAISTEGVKVVSFNIDTCGFFARDIEDLQLLADVFAFEKTPGAQSTSLEGARIAFVEGPTWDMAGSGTVAAMNKAKEILQRHGASVETVDLPADFHEGPSAKQTHDTILESEAQAAFLMEYLMDKEKLDPKIRGLVENESSITQSDRLEAADRYALLRHKFDPFASNFAAIVTPSAIDVAPLGLHDMGDSCFNFLWTGLHAPTVHIPAFKGAHDLPIGLSIVAGRFRDQYLLQICRTLSKLLVAEAGWDGEEVLEAGSFANKL